MKLILKMNKKIIYFLLLNLAISSLIFMPIPYPKENSAFTKHLPTTLKVAGYYEMSFIHIDNNWTAAEAEEWCYKMGNTYYIENVTIDASSTPISAGILIENSQNDYFVIRNCTIMNTPSPNSGAAIKLINTNNGTIIDNNLTDNWVAIRLESCYNNRIINNDLTENGGTGILLSLSQRNLIQSNTISKGSYQGIYLQATSDNNTIQNNIISEYTGGTDAGFGIIIQSSDISKIRNNELSDNDYAIFIRTDSNNNSFTENYVDGNNKYGALIRDPNCDYNEFFRNEFKNVATNVVNAYDNGTSTKWDNGEIGNYWHDYDGKDENDDGIGDTPYKKIAGLSDAVDNYPIWDDGEEKGDNNDDEEGELNMIESLIEFIQTPIGLITGGILLIGLISVIIIIKKRR